MKERLIANLLENRFISTADQVKIADKFQVKQVRNGDWLIKAGTVARHLYFINEGVLKITIPHVTEKDIVYYFMESPQFMTFLYSMYGNIPAQQGLQAATDSQILTIGMDDLMALYEEIPYLRGLIDEIAQLSMAHMVTIKNIYAGRDALDKYKLFLTKQKDIATQVALSDIASYLGIRAQSLSRVRRQLVGLL